jgi:putative ABC transport system permease protein
MTDWRQLVRERLPRLGGVAAAREAEILEELAELLEDTYADSRQRGMTHGEALARALAQLPDGRALARRIEQAERPVAGRLPSHWHTEQVEDQLIRTRGGSVMNDFWQDLRYGLRMLRKNPGFTAVAVFTLALGIGANTAIFSVVHGVLLRPLGHADPDRLVMIWANDTREKSEKNFFSMPDVQEYRAQLKSFEHLAAFSPQWSFVLTAGEPERIRGYWVSASVFPMFGIRPLLGRGFTAEEDRAGGPPVAVISYALWQRRLGGDPQIVGKPLALEGTSATIIGVLPPSFRWLDTGDIFVPLMQNPRAAAGRQLRMMVMGGRLKPGVTIEQARAEMDAQAAGLAAQYPATNNGIGGTLLPLHEEITGKARPALLALLGAVAFILLIACVNVASLLLARAATRQREIAVRAALGAGRARLARQLMAESLLLAGAAAVAGLLLATWGMNALVNFLPADLPRREEIRVDAVVLLFTLAATLVTGVCFGLAPAWQLSKLALGESLKEGARGASQGTSAGRLRGALVAAEVAICVVVVIGTGLLVRSFIKLHAVDPGFHAESVLSFEMPVPSRYADPVARLALYDRFYTRVEALPGVLAAGDTTRLPLAGRYGNPTSVLSIEGDAKPESELPQVDFRRAGRNYFQAMQIPLLSGRFFAATDTPATEPVAILNQVAAQRFFPGQDPVGRRVRAGSGTQPWLRVVGVVGSVRHDGLQAAPRPELYVAVSQNPPVNPQVVVRATGDAAALAPAIRQAVREIDPAIPLFYVETLEQVRYRSLAQPRFQVYLFGAFAGLALVLAVVGVYGVMAYSVAQRTREIGIRMALGAQRSDVLRLILRHGALLAGVGVAIGLALAFGLSRFLATLLFETSVTDPITYAAVVALLALIALAACLIPAGRASRVDPLVALRHE